MSEHASALQMRRATVDDLEAIYPIETASFGELCWSKDTVRGELERNYYLVLVDHSGGVLGYAGLAVSPPHGDIQTIALVPEVRGQGYGRRMMNGLLDEANRVAVREVFLEARADNPVARGLYASLGFEDIALRKNYYQPGNVDAVIMKLEMGHRR